MSLINKIAVLNDPLPRYLESNLQYLAYEVPALVH